MDVLMPQLGETVAEGKILKWFKSAGDVVNAGDNLFEIETDKTSMDVPSTVAGTLTDIRFEVGEMAKVGAVVAVISGTAETAPSRMVDTPVRAPQTPHISPPTGSRSRTAWALCEGVKKHGSGASFAYPQMEPFREVRTPEHSYGPAKLLSGSFATPLARRRARECGIDLSRINGSGPHGRIVVADVEKATYARGTTGIGAAQVKALYESVAYEEAPLSSMRLTIAKRLVETKQTIPHFYLTADVDVGRLIAMREAINAAASKKDGQPAFRLSLNDLIIKAWAVALQRVPAANAVWAHDRILRFKSSDIGFAVALDGGLLTPIIRDANTKSLSAISTEMRDLAARAQARRLAPSEYQGGTSAISNLGMYGIREFSAIINPPHATILAVGALRRAPVETADGRVGFVSQFTVTLSCDHRAVDGAISAELMKAFKALIENPIMMVV